jgi:hypothetical protein
MRHGEPSQKLSPKRRVGRPDCLDRIFEQIHEKSVKDPDFNREKPRGKPQGCPTKQIALRCAPSEGRGLVERLSGTISLSGVHLGLA